ncbi:MAG: helicase, partial [Gammaproteobacteria bacterium]
CGLNLVTHSHGLLSRSEAENHAVISHDVRRAQCIAIDEAHNFLNPKSSRTRSLLGNMADHVVLFTATPINKGVRDLISIVELLGADNLDDEALKLFDELALRMRRQRNQFVLRDDERRRLRAIVGRFTLRRTKRDLKLQAQRHPEAFVDDDNQPCTYPEHVAHTYETRETVEDQELAEQIRELAGRLKGMVNLGKGIEFPESLRGMASPEKFVSARLKSAAALAYYHVMSALRSSRPALVEHILGTDEACRRFGLDASLKPTPTGNILRSLDGIIGQVHPSNVAELLPTWLLDKQAHAAAVREEIEIYEQILARVERMSDARDRGKARQLLKLHRRHPSLIAFDSCLISLAWIRRLLLDSGCESPVIVATGANPQSRRKVAKLLAPGSKTRRLIVLCSDALSEGINLQKASAVVMLDMPSVIRVAEQRIGRVDRLNSPHARVEIWWPKDSPSFALKTDAKFIRRHRDVAAILG